MFSGALRRKEKPERQLPEKSRSYLTTEIHPSRRRTEIQERDLPYPFRIKERRLEMGKLCEASSECGENEYCMSCEKCEKFAHNLEDTEVHWWNCNPCEPEDKRAYCESGRFCDRSNDAIEEKCPETYPGCSLHSDCYDNEYCFDCFTCENYKGARNEAWDCSPCPHVEKKGFCGKLNRCELGEDSIDFICPEYLGCSSHTECGEGKYCEDCEKCHQYGLGLTEEEALAWTCEPCPTKKGGICENEAFCNLATDSIDNTCPLTSACSKHTECPRDRYCMGCKKCDEYRASLANPETWSCKPCPTEQGGACEIANFCPVAKDAIDGVCPEFLGCKRHSDCINDANSFCMGYEACIVEVGKDKCGVRPERGGYCVSDSYCTPERSITKKCDEIITGCSHHKDCPNEMFCTGWEDCKNQRGISVCGAKPLTEGICVANSHCSLGLHAPIDGVCPLAATVGKPEITARLGFQLEGVQLATIHQSMNIWYNIKTKEERAILQMHDNGGDYSVLDDREYFASYLVQSNGSMKEEWRAETSCPFVEVIMPHHSPYVYEVRVTTPLESHGEVTKYCSCLKGDFEWVPSGACPRGVRLSKNPPTRVHNLYFDNAAHFAVKTKSTLYSVDREITHMGYYISDDVRSCPKTDSGEFYPLNTGCKQILDDGKIIPEVDGKWCVVSDKECAPALKYRMCRASNAKGVVFLAPDDNKLDLILRITLLDASEECTGHLIPAVYIQGLDTETMDSLAAGTLEITIGPEIPLGKPLDGFEINSGGVRVYDTSSKTWVHHFELFGAVEYAETSPIRDVMFVCEGPADQTKIRVFDISPYIMDAKKLDTGCTFTDSEEELAAHRLITLDTCKRICGNNRRCMGINVDESSIYKDAKIPVLRCMLILAKHPMDPADVEWNVKLGVIFFIEKCYRKIRATEGPTMREVPGTFPNCTRGSTRDYHIVDSQGLNGFHTALVDPQDNNNRIYIYDTTDLRTWGLLQTVHANWEDEDSGLGQVVANTKGGLHLITWHCYNDNCEGSFGRDIYILNTATLDTNSTVSIEAKIKLPMKEGTIAKDVGCNNNDLCLVSMNHDGVSVIDLDAPEGPQIISSHLETFNTDSIPIPIFRQISGAQKVYPSKGDANRWYVERSTFDWDAYSRGVSLNRATKRDSLYVMDLEPKYDRNHARFQIMDPVALGTFVISLSWNDVTSVGKSMFDAGADLEKTFENHLIGAAGMALKVPSDRFKVLTIDIHPAMTRIPFEIMPGTGASPDTLFQMLQRQLFSEHSAIHRTKLQDLIQFITLERGYQQPNKLSKEKPPQIEVRNEARYIVPHYDLRHYDKIGRKQLIGLSIVVGLMCLLLLISLAYAARQKRKVMRLEEECTLKTRGTSGLLTESHPMMVTSGQLNDVFVVGRPAAGVELHKRESDSSANENYPFYKGNPEPDNVNVVGAPVDNRPSIARAPERRSNRLSNY